MAEKIYFGVPGLVQEVPAPASGMTFVSNVDVEETTLVSGGRSVYRPPTAFQTFNMTWRTNSANLKFLIDMYNGQFGPGPFYLVDPVMSQLNVLPPRWSNAWQLAYQANGWCKPFLQAINPPTSPAITAALTDRQVVFTQASSGTAPTSGVLRFRTIRVPGKQYWLAAKGSATGGAGIIVRGYNASTNAWSVLSTFVDFTGTPAVVVATAASQYSFIELDISMPLGSQLTLSGLALSTVGYTSADTAYMPTGTGIGAVNFSGTANGTLVSSTIDRVGMSLDFTEVQSIDGGTV